MVQTKTGRDEVRAAPLLQLSGVGKSYGRCTVFHDLDLELAPGEILGLLGPNGAGKTTLLRMMVGLLRPDVGDVRLARQAPIVALARCPVAYFAGEASLPPDVRSRTWIRLLGCEDVAGIADKPIRKLSKGTRQRLGLEVALAGSGARLLVLDEPWEGLDPDASRWLRTRVQDLVNAGAMAVLSSHRMHDLAGICDQYAFLVEGRLILRSAADIAPQRQVTGDDLLQAFDRVREIA